MKNIVKEILKKLIFNVKLYRHKKRFFFSQKNTFGLSVKQIKKSNKLGFTADEYAIYDLDNNDPNDYISEFERELFRDAVRDYRVLLDNKIVFYNLIRNFGRVNEIFAYKKNGNYVCISNEFEQKNILKKIKEIGYIVYKEISMGGGVGFRLLSYISGGYCINRTSVKEEDIEELLLQDNYLLEEYCRQGQFENNIWPYSVNTIRVISLAYQGDCRVAAAIQRIGMDEKKCVDNACMGGLYAEIDIKTGCMSAARSHSKDNLLNRDGTKKIFSYHPITKSVIQGTIIPGWKDICNDVIKLHHALTFTGIEFIAWDIALTEDGYRVIEANTSCSMDFLQTSGGARNGIIGKWMKVKGYLR